MTDRLGQQIMALEDYVLAGICAYISLFGGYDEEVEGFDRFLAEQVLIANAEHVFNALYDIMESDGFREKFDG